MAIKDIFNEAARWVIFLQRSSAFKREFEKTDFSRDYVDEVFEGFENRQNTFREFVQSNSNISSLCFSEQLEEEASSKKQITSWQEYFDLIKTSIAEVMESEIIDKDDNFLEQLEYRTKLFEDYYTSQGNEMKKLLDIYASKLDIEDLCGKTEDAKHKIISQAKAQINNINNINKTNIAP